MLMHATALQPSLAVFPGPTAYMNGIGANEAEAATELPYDGYETDPPAHYPKPGNGLARTLPPETEDLNWLLDDNIDVFNQVNNYPTTSNDGINGVMGGHVEATASVSR
jgi:hypothetical protein